MFSESSAHQRDRDDSELARGARPAGPPLPVAFLIDQLGVGGAEREFVDLLAALDPRRIDARVGVLRPGGALLSSLAHPPGFAPTRRLGGPALVRSVQRWLRGERVQAVHTTHAWSAVAVGLRRRTGKRGDGPPWVWVDTEHSFHTPPASPRLEWLRKRVVRRADRVLAVSQAQAQWLRGYLGVEESRVVVVPNGIRVDAFATPAGAETVRWELGLPPDAVLAVSVGRLSREKGHAVLLEAWSDLPGHLVLVGDGPERMHLEAMARRPALEGRVHLVGERLEVAPFLAAATVFCLPSFEESQGISLLEAMAAGVPVIASAVGGVPEIVTDPSLGRLVPPGNAAALADALREVLQDEAWRRETAAAARVWVRRRFDLSERARVIEDLLWNLARPGARPGTAEAGGHE